MKVDKALETGVWLIAFSLWVIFRADDIGPYSGPGLVETDFPAIFSSIEFVRVEQFNQAGSSDYFELAIYLPLYGRYYLRKPNDYEFDKYLSELSAGDLVTVRHDTKKEDRGYRLVSIYKGTRPVLTFEETVSASREATTVIRFVAAGILVIGLLSLVYGIRKFNQEKTRFKETKQGVTTPSTIAVKADRADTTEKRPEWSKGHTGDLEITADALVFKDWRIPYSDIKESLFGSKSYVFSTQQVLMLKTSDASYDFKVTDPIAMPVVFPFTTEIRDETSKSDVIWLFGAPCITAILFWYLGIL